MHIPQNGTQTSIYYSEIEKNIEFSRVCPVTVLAYLYNDSCYKSVTTFELTEQ